jgi:multiple sugar transport system ATP-binding protein
MDEPLSNLDAKLRVAMRAEVSELQRHLKATMFYVTHDQVEAMTMGDRVAVMDRGLLQQVATPSDLYNKPTNAFVAGFIGSPPMNRITAAVRSAGDGSVHVSSGDRDITILSDGFRSLPSSATAASSVILGIRPEHLELVAEGDGIPGIVRLVEHLGSEQIVHVDPQGIDIFNPDHKASDMDGTPRILLNLRDENVRLRPGDSVHLRVAARHLHAFDADTPGAPALTNL